MTTSPLANPTATRELLEEFGLATKHRLGQNFLVDNHVIERICELAELAGDERVLEVGPGVGTLTLALLQEAACVNKLDNVDVIGGDAVREFPDQDADVLVVDPPRAGLAPEAIDLIASTSARDVAYVSCDPATLARDLKRFVEEGTFSPVKITPVDLFPQTFHCETVVHLKRN